MSIILANFGKYAISDCPFIALSVGTEYMLQIVDVNTKSQIQITANAGYQNF